MQPESILIVSGSPATAATAAVLSVLLDIPQQAIAPESISKSLKLPRRSLLILTETQLNHLAALRSSKFAGAVLVLCYTPFNTVKAKHRILRWGKGSHDGCDFPWQLTDILTKAAALVPMEPENLKMLRNELKAPVRWFQQRLQPRLRRMQQAKGNCDRDLEAIVELTAQLRDKTPVTFHAIVEIDGDRAQLQQHLNTAIAQLSQNGTRDSTAIDKLAKTFETWRDLVSATGESSI